MKVPLILALSCAMTCSVFAQSQDGQTKPKAPHKGSAKSVFPNEIQELKDAVAAQQQQIQQLQQQISTRDQAIQQLQNEVKNIPTPPAPPAPTDYGSDINALQGDVKDLKSQDVNMADSLTETQKRIGDLESPTSIHYKGMTITPGGFLAGETVWRQRATLGDINTPFNGIPFSAAGQARQTEFYGSGRQSRLALLFQGKTTNVTLGGYFEMDFLSAGVTSNNNQSNSYTMRQRQAYASAAFQSGWTLTAGQMWSLVTETRKGLDNRTEATPLQIDAQYVAGFSWDRGYGFRVSKNFNNKLWAGISIENSQEIVTAHGNPTNFLLGGPGTGGGLYNPTANYSSNLSPDYVGKLHFEPGFGTYEVFAVGSLLRERIYPNAPTNASGAFNNTTYGIGFGANARWLFAKKKVETGLHFLGGNGIGRYGSSGLPDATVDGSGQLHPLRSYQANAELDLHFPKWDWYFDGGGEYVGDWSTLLKGKPVGYGSPYFVNTGCGTETLPTAANGYGPGPLASCTGDTRAIIEGTAGFWYKPYNGPKGRLQMGLQYSYLTRDTWKGINGKPEAIDNMIFSSFRYYLP
ncbi:MAG: hypothetical protein WAM71_19375 [Candidatus Korobacteraceae bacterium]